MRARAAFRFRAPCSPSTVIAALSSAAAGICSSGNAAWRRFADATTCARPSTRDEQQRTSARATPRGGATSAGRGSPVRPICGQRDLRRREPKLVDATGQRGRQFGRRLEPIFRPLGEHRGQHAGQRVGHIRPQLAHVRRRLALMLQQLLQHRAFGNGGRPVSMKNSVQPSE